MPIEYLTPGIEDRAFEVQMLLADRGQHRAPSIPDLPTIAEAGVTGYETTIWIALFAPAKTPPDVVRMLNAEVEELYDLMPQGGKVEIAE